MYHVGRQILMKAPCLHHRSAVHDAKATGSVLTAKLNALAIWVAEGLCDSFGMLKAVALQVHSKQPPVC